MSDDDPYERPILDDVARVGWSVIGIEADADGPAFAYSVGMMHTLAHAEITVFGLRMKTMVTIINDMGEQIRQGRGFEGPGLYEGVVAQFPCKCLPVSEAWYPEYFGYAMWHQRHVGQNGILRVVQLLWPDRAGIFPDEAGFDQSFRHFQPLLQSP